MIKAILFLVFASGGTVLGQGVHYTYPFKVECPTEIVRAGESASVTAKFEDGHTGDIYSPNYSWTVSFGTVITGQGTPSITVEVAKGESGALIVTLDRNFSEAHYPGVQRSANCTINIDAAPSARMIDEFQTAGNNCEEGFARLDAFFEELSYNPSDIGLIVIYGDVREPKAARRREQQLLNHFTFRKFDRGRVEIIRGAAREAGTTQLWLVPPGADRPAFAQATESSAIAPPPTQPFLYASDYADGIPGCFGNRYDLEDFANVVQNDPKNVARVVIGESSQTKYRRKVREIVTELSRLGISRNRIVTVYKYVRPNRLLEVTELWVVPPKPHIGLLTTENELPIATHRCPQGGLAWLARC